MRKIFLLILFITFNSHSFSKNLFPKRLERSQNSGKGYLDTLPKPSESIKTIATKTDTVPSSADFDVPKEFIVDSIEVIGTKYLDNSLLVNISRLRSGIRIKLPGDEKISEAVKSLWAQGLFENVRINAIRVSGEHLSLQLELVERPRLGRYE
jgi:outer membrane protein assembly factor BamA